MGKAEGCLVGDRLKSASIRAIPEHADSGKSAVAHTARYRDEVPRLVGSLWNNPSRPAIFLDPDLVGFGRISSVNFVTFFAPQSRFSRPTLIHLD